MRRVSLVAVFIVMVILTITGCTSAPAATPSTPTTPATSGPISGGILRIITTATMRNLGHPGQTNANYDNIYSKPAVESLVTYEEKGTGLPVPQLAESWQISPDYTSITFNLRQGVKFHDGTQFNAEAAKYNLDQSKLGVGKTLLSTVKSIDVINDYVIRLNLSAWTPSIFTDLVQPISMMVSPTALKTYGDLNMTNPVGTGPFRFVSYQRDVSLKYERFNEYWGGKPYLDGVEWLFITQPLTALTSFKAGEADVIIRIDPKDAAGLESEGKVITSVPFRTTGITGDGAHQTSIFSNIDVRRAIAYAIDNSAIAKAISFGTFKVATQIAAPGLSYYNSAVVGYPYNPQKAKDLLKSAGYPNGFETKLVFESIAPYNDTFAAVQSYLKAVGITVQLDPAPTNRYVDVASGGWNNHLVMMSVPCSPGFDFGTALNGRLSKKSGRFNPNSQLIPEDYNTKLLQANSEKDAEKRNTILKELGKIIIDDYCLMTPIYIETNVLAKSSKLQGFDLYEYAANDWRPYKAWFKK